MPSSDLAFAAPRTFPASPPRRRGPFTVIARCVAVVAALAALAGCGSPSAGAQGRLRVIDATIDEPVSPDVAAVRFVIDNGTSKDDTLESVASSAARSVSVHRSTTDSAGRSTMVPVARLDIPARSEVTFEPGGLHVMLTGLKAPLRLGDKVDLTVRFAQGGTIPVVAKVVKPGTVVDHSAHTGGTDDGSSR